MRAAQAVSAPSPPAYSRWDSPRLLRPEPLGEGGVTAAGAVAADRLSQRTSAADQDHIIRLARVTAV
jgi:hypothetical protein